MTPGQPLSLSVIPIPLYSECNSATQCGVMRESPSEAVRGSGTAVMRVESLERGTLWQGAAEQDPLLCFESFLPPTSVLFCKSKGKEKKEKRVGGAGRKRSEVIAESSPHRDERPTSFI